MNEKKKIAFYTLGCKLNFSETSQISRSFPPDKYEIVNFNDFADIYIVNTCVVTEKAEKKSRSIIRQAKKKNPKAIVAAVGCYTEIHPDEIASIKGTDFVLGAANKFMVKEIIEEGKITTNDSLGEQFISSYSLGDRTRSFFKIQDGCDYFCAYCTVPFARGRSRSDTVENTMKVANEIAFSGVKEIILTGVNVGDFGRKNNENLLELMKQLEQLNGIERIRISSIEPNLLTNEIIDFVASSQKFLPHFHIPLQSASTKILNAMKRRYDVPLFAERIARIKRFIPDCCIAVDLIVGFPGETASDFNESYHFLKESAVSYIHVFTYSERENTPAVSMSDVVPHEERTARSKKMLALSNEKKKAFYKQNIGKEKWVLFESDNDHGYMYGFTENYIKVKTPFNEKWVNQIKKVRLTKIEKDDIFAVDFI